MARVIAYVDGFNLYHGLRERYFTATVRNDPSALARQQTYLAALAAHCGPTLEVVLGRAAGAAPRDAVAQTVRTEANVLAATMT